MAITCDLVIHVQIQSVLFCLLNLFTTLTDNFAVIGAHAGRLALCKLCSEVCLRLLLRVIFFVAAVI